MQKKLQAMNKQTQVLLNVNTSTKLSSQGEKLTEIKHYLLKDLNLSVPMDIFQSIHSLSSKISFNSADFVHKNTNY